MHARLWLSCVAQVCGSSLQLSWAVQCSTDHVWRGGPFNRWPAPKRHPTHHNIPPILPHPPSLSPSSGVLHCHLHSGVATGLAHPQPGASPPPTLLPPRPLRVENSWSFPYTHDNHAISSSLPPSLFPPLSSPSPPSIPLAPSLSSLPPSLLHPLTRYTIDHASDFPTLTMEPRFYLISGVVCSMSITEKYT